LFRWNDPNHTQNRRAQRRKNQILQIISVVY
jgi:hypothetical protein